MSNSARLTLMKVEGDGLRFEATVGSGHHATVDSGAGSVASSPIELLLVSLASCMAMDVISIMRKKRQPVTGYEIDVRGERRAEPPRSFSSIEMVHRFHGVGVTLDAARRSIELSDTKYCSVRASLDPAIVITNHVELVPEPVSGPASARTRSLR